MKKSKVLAFACCAALTFTMIGCSSSSDSDNSIDSTESGGEDMTTGLVTPSSENVKQLGRTELIDDTLWVALSGAGIDFSYTGTKLEVTLVGDGAATVSGNDTNYARAAIYVDGERVIDDMIDNAEETYTVFESDEAQTVNVRIVKLSECAMSTFGIKPLSVGDDGSVTPTEEKERKIEFIGDSITCGYGVDDENENHSFSTATEDVTKAYAYKTAEALDADYSMFSISGYGIISGYTSTDEKVSAQTIPQYYESLGFSYNSFASTTQPQSIEWDFSKFEPDVIVINLGTNDASYCGSDSEKQDEFSAAYVEFLKQVREDNPNAAIICSLGIMGQQLYSSIEMAVYTYTNETGDENISTLKFDQQDSTTDGLAADWHPTEATHEKAAQKLVEQIQLVTGWE